MGGTVSRLFCWPSVPPSSLLSNQQKYVMFLNSQLYPHLAAQPILLNKNNILCSHKQSNHLSKVALEGPIDSIGLAGQGSGCVILGNSKRIAAMHPIVLARAIIDLTTGCCRPPWTLSHNCTSQATGHLEMSC